MKRQIHSHFCFTLKLIVASTVTMALTNCGEDEITPLTKAAPGPVPISDQRPGDPEAGYEFLVGGGYISCGIPYNAWQRVASPLGTAHRIENGQARDTTLPYYLTLQKNPDGVEVVTTNCLWCHGGLVEGELIIGLGNENLDFTSDSRTYVNDVGAYVSGKQEITAWRKWADRITAIAPYMITDTVGINPAANLTLALIAHRDPDTLAWSDAPLLEPPPEKVLPLSVPPWWNMKKKHAMFYNAMGRGDHVRFMMMKSLLCTDSVEEVERLEKNFVNVRAFIASLEPPVYPYDIDKSLAGEGEVIFLNHCAGCHGTYGSRDYYPNLVVDLNTVGTDPAYALRAYEDSDRFMAWFNTSWYGIAASARPAPGYIAPPLDGIWATAPYLHNGSVPTLETLMNSGKRPMYWMRNFDSSDFDQDEVGWTYKKLSYGKSGASDTKMRKHIYDTTLLGYSNQGHSFGDVLTPRERRSLIEYLKSL